MFVYTDVSECQLVRTCGQCGVMLSSENTGDLKWLQPNCDYCSKHPATYEKYQKILAFTKRMTDIGDLWTTTEVEDLAIELLTEIGEIE